MLTESKLLAINRVSKFLVALDTKLLFSLIDNKLIKSRVVGEKTVSNSSSA